MAACFDHLPVLHLPFTAESSQESCLLLYIIFISSHIPEAGGTAPSQQPAAAPSQQPEPEKQLQTQPSDDNTLQSSALSMHNDLRKVHQVWLMTNICSQ